MIRRLLSSSWAPYICVLLIVAYVAGVAASERHKGGDQFCTSQETIHLRDAEDLNRTYTYLKTLPQAKWKDPLNQVIVVFLPQTEKRSRTDVAPPICDTTYAGVPWFWKRYDYGRPEPDPKLPRRCDFTYILTGRVPKTRCPQPPKTPAQVRLGPT